MVGPACTRSILPRIGRRRQLNTRLGSAVRHGRSPPCLGELPAPSQRATSVEMVYEMATSRLFLFKRDCLYCQFSLTSIILSHSRAGGFPASRKDFQSHIAARLGPFIVLLGQDRADQADDRVAAGKIPTTSVRLPTSLLRRSFIRPWRSGQAAGVAAGQRVSRPRWPVRASATRAWRAASPSQPRVWASACRCWMSVSWFWIASLNSGPVVKLSQVSQMLA
jgi:hypothetical protein